jgi:hypothetical protein
VLLDPEGEGAMDFGDPRLAEFLGFEAATAREAVVQVFGGNRSAVNVHAQRLLEWMGDPSGELDRSTFGG